MKKKISIIIWLLTIIIPTGIYTQTMPDYCSISPFVTRTVPPNIAIILDNSTGMLSPAYPLTDHYDSSDPTAYIGYFDPQTLYCARTDFFYETSGQCQIGERGPYPGAMLNWASMSRYDMLMLALVGGLGATDPVSRDLAGDSLNRGWTKTAYRYPNCNFTMADDSLFITGEGCELQNPGAKVVVRNGRKKRGLIPGMADRNNDGTWDTFAPRIAVIGFQPSRNDIVMAHCGGGANSISSLYKAIAGTAPDEEHSDAPLGRAVVRAIEYFKNTCSVCGPCADPVDSIPCRKNFIINLSGGDATDIPARYSADYLNEEIRKAHTSDIRPDRDGTQLIQFFSVNIFGTEIGRNVMKGFSKYGGFIDINGNRLPDLRSEWDKNGDGVPDTYFDVSDSDAIHSRLEQVFSHISTQSASGTGVSVFGSNSNAAGGIIQTFFLPAQREVSGEILWAGYMRNLWTDRDKNLREDSVNDHKLILSQDKIVKYFSTPGSDETKAALFTTLSDGSGGTFSNCSNPEIKASFQVTPLWEAGRSLAIKEPSARTIFTSKKILRGDKVTHTFSETPYPAFEVKMNSVLLDALNPDAKYSADNIVRYIRGECLETSVTGDTPCSVAGNPSFRDRRISIAGVSRVWKLGDIMNSTPKVFAGMPLNAYHIDYADRSYYDFISDDRYRIKSSVVFAGANDGMIHAFRGGYLQDKGLIDSIKAILKNTFGSGDGEHDRLGEEIWAYIPFNAFPYLKYLLDPYYCHINYSDLPVKVFDVSLRGGAGAMKDRSSWRTILIGGMRFGGACGTGGYPADPPPGSPANVGFSSFFALDVTDPERPVPLWEFSDNDMGYATSGPAIVRTGDRNQNGKWHVVFGSGSKLLPKDGNDIGRNIPGYVYILDLGTGKLVKKIALDHNAIVGDILAVDADRDYVTEKIYFGTSYQQGSSWKGKMISLDVPAALDSSGIDIVWNSSFGRVLYSGNYPFTASPDAAKDTKGSLWLYSGSGKYFSDVDETDTSRQIVFGIQDRNETISESSLFDATHVLTSGSVASTEKVCAYDSRTNSFGLRDIVTSIRSASTAFTIANPGWKIYLSDGERVISRPAAVGGLLDFLSYKPDSDPCVYSGDSYLYSVNHTTGLAPSRVAIRSPEITTGTSGSITVLKSIPLGKGAPPVGDAIVLHATEKGNEDVRKKIQISGGAVAEAENRPLFSVISKVVHWLKK